MDWPVPEICLELASIADPSIRIITTVHYVTTYRGSNTLHQPALQLDPLPLLVVKLYLASKKLYLASMKLYLTSMKVYLRASLKFAAIVSIPWNP